MMQKRFFLIAAIAMLLAASLSLMACSGKESHNSSKEAVNENKLDAPEGMQDTGDKPVSDSAVANQADTSGKDAAGQAEEEIIKADKMAQEIAFNKEANLGADMGTYVKTLAAYTFDSVNYNGRQARLIQLFWQCKDGRAGEISSAFAKEQWSVQLFYDKDEFLGMEINPCEYSMVVAAQASIKLMNNEEGVNLLYDTYIDADYSSVVSKEEYRKNWTALTDRLGSFVGVKSLLHSYFGSFSYPYVSVLIEFEKGQVLQNYYYKPGTVKAFNIISRDYTPDELPELVSTVSPTPYPEDPLWLAELENFKDSPFDLTAALTAPSLKDLCSDYFKLGAGLYGSALNNCAINSPEYMIVVKKHFNSVTLTNLMKPAYILDQARSKQNAAQGIEDPALSFTNCDATLQWCMENGVQLRGHTLVWHAQTPEWFFKEGFSDNGALVDRETMLYRLESYIRQYLTYVQENYPGVVYCWDVVNEAVEPSSAGDPNSFFYCRTSYDNGKPNLWYQVIGEDYVEMAFTYARKYAAEGVALFYNDYNAYDPVKMENIYKLCEYLNSKGLIDGIGMQGYWGISYPALGTIKNAINKYAELGLEIQITELSIGADNTTREAFEAQGIRYASIMRLLQSLDTASGGKANITAVTFFGLMDGYMLYSNDTNTSRLFDSGLQPKPAFAKIVETFEMFY